MAKIDWLKAKNDYISSETISLHDIAIKYGVSHTVTKERASKEKWLKIRKDLLQKVDLRLTEKTVETIADINARHIRNSKTLQARGMAIINDDKKMKKINPDIARKFFETGVKIERKAAGLDTGQASTINVAVMIKNDRDKYGF